ncbi:SIR2 family protein [Treponema socranskii]|uniref:SIR2 family protein n=2 Tax=Treponema TaxID=157 RepID=UPI003D94F5F5
MGIHIKELRDKILTGKAILFCGAGFSNGAKNIIGEFPPFSKDLSKKISKLGHFKESENLRYTSDKYISTNKNDLSKLIDLLADNFSIKETSLAQNNIISYPWRRIYTTNYDDVVEVAARKNSKNFDCICIDDNSRDFFKKNNMCVHINGYINGLTDKKLLNGYLKLSKSSYFSSNSFENSNWYYSFKKDLENASLILFIGYSLYDIEIEKILFNGNYKDKTYFITGIDENEENLYTLNQYGTALNLGVDAFGEQLNKYDEVSSPIKLINYNSIFQYEILDIPSELISDNEINQFIMQGNIKNEYLNINYIENSKKPYIIKRKYIDEAVTQIKNGNNVIIYGEFGNGKTIFLEELKSKLAIEGKIIYYTKYPDEHLFNDFDLICSKNKEFVLVIDSYSKYLDFIEYVIQCNYKTVLLILSDKSGLHERNYLILQKSCNKSYSYKLNKLDDKELETMTSIISNIGFWGERIRFSDERNTDYLREKCSSELSSILLGIFDAPQIKTKITDIFFKLTNKDSIKRTILSICLLKMMDIPIDEARISEMSGNSEIYDTNLINNSNFKLLFPSNSGEINVKSSLFASSLIKNCFEPTFVKDVLLYIAKKFDNLKYNGSYIEESIFKSTVKFSFIQRLFLEKDKRSLLVSYYDSLKTEVSWLKKDPHYWLQYGMAELNFNNISKCEQYLKNSYELAKMKSGYDTMDIDTQYARLLLKKALIESNGKKIIALFSEANNLLVNLPNDHYRIRQIYLYKEFYDKKFKFLNKQQQDIFYSACKIIYKTIEDFNLTSNIRDSNYLSNQLIMFFKSIIKT